MKRIISFCLFLFVLVCFTPLLQANFHPQPHPNARSEDALELGLALETEFWTLVQEHKVQEFAQKISPIFQGLSIAGIDTRDEQINGLASSIVGSFSIQNPVASRFGDTLVISYDFIAVNSNLTSGPTISIWKKSGCNWRMVSHSYVPF